MNIGDSLSRLTQGVLKSTTHRVINPQCVPTRISVAFFLEPPFEAIIEPISDCEFINNNKDRDESLLNLKPYKYGDN